MTIWFSSDLHLHHANIIQYAKRPFKDVKEMNDCLLTLHNERVKPVDHWYNLGDVTMERDGQGRGLEILSQFHGHKRLILGNHDHYKMRQYLVYFEKVMATNRLGGLMLTHIPVHPQSLGRALANVHGHTHDHPDYEPVAAQQFDKVWEGKTQVPARLIPYINISVERTNYAPITLEDILERVRVAATARPTSAEGV